MAITLGKDTQVIVDGSVLPGVRSISWSGSARTIEVHEYGSRLAAVYTTGYEVSVSIEVIDSDGVFGAFDYFQNGGAVVISGGAGGWEFPFTVTSIAESDPLDGVATFTIEAKLTPAGIK